MTDIFNPHNAEFIHVRETLKGGRSWYVIEAFYSDEISLHLAESADFYAAIQMARKAASSGMRIQIDLLPKGAVHE